MINLSYDLSTWKTSNGDLVQVKTMSDIHIQKVIYLLNKNITRSQTLTVLIDFLNCIAPPTSEFEASETRADSKEQERHLRIATLLEELRSRKSPLYEETINQLKKIQTQKSHLLN